MNQRTEDAIDLLAFDAAKSLEKHGTSQTGISAWNYGLKPTKQVLARLREYGFQVSTYGVMGYIHFTIEGKAND